MYLTLSGPHTSRLAWAQVPSAYGLVQGTPTRWTCYGDLLSSYRRTTPRRPRPPRSAFIGPLRRASASHCVSGLPAVGLGDDWLDPLRLDLTQRFEIVATLNPTAYGAQSEDKEIEQMRAEMN